MKKILALILALMMLFVGMSVAFADGDTGDGGDGGDGGNTGTTTPTGTITITVPTKETAPTVDTKYEIYKVFEATVNADDTSKVSYTLPSGKSITGDMATYFKLENGNVTALPAAKDSEGNLTAGAIAAIAAFVNGDEPVATVTVAAGATSGSTDLPYGYYYITTTSGTVVTIDSNNDSPTVKDKNIIPKVVKSAGTQYDSASLAAIAAVGTSQDFTAEIDVGKGTVNLKFKDEMTHMTYNGDAKVYVGGAEVTGNDKFTISGATGDASFTIDFKDAYIATLEPGTKITIKYSGKITEAGLTRDPATNTASITSGDGNGSTSEVVEVFNATITVEKQDGSSAPLEGAKFKLKNGAGKYYAGATTDGTANWTTDGVEVEAVLVDGKYVAEFTGLAPDTYTLEESTVPAGYNKAPDKTITIADSSATANLEQAAIVINNSGAELPSTGGFGTTLFYIGGAALVLLAIVLLVTKRRMSVNE